MLPREVELVSEYTQGWSVKCYIKTCTFNFFVLFAACSEDPLVLKPQRRYTPTTRVNRAVQQTYSAFKPFKEWRVRGTDTYASEMCPDKNFIFCDPHQKDTRIWHLWSRKRCRRLSVADAVMNVVNRIFNDFSVCHVTVCSVLHLTFLHDINGTVDTFNIALRHFCDVDLTCLWQTANESWSREGLHTNTIIGRQKYKRCTLLMY